ncbi:MAG: hypothetical protein ACD_8C00057G0011 [uncultured bacterium]|nr:MAG: hypothetical protein ACD_8C00057G0011 [uncultured bacterium]
MKGVSPPAIAMLKHCGQAFGSTFSFSEKMLHIKNKNDNTHKKAFAVEVSMCLMLLVIFSTGIVQASDITTEMVIELTNRARSSAGVAVLKKDELLTKAAQEKAQDMLDKDYFAHVSPEGKTPWDWITGAGYDYQYAGENLAINFTNAEDEQKAWMESELHRKNIMNPKYEEIGVAVKSGKIEGKNTIVVVQEFGTRMSPIISKTVSTEKSQPVAGVVGLAVTVPTDDLVLLETREQISPNKFFEKNPLALWSWIGIFSVAIAVLIIDVLALFHGKHGQLIILHEMRNKRV